MRRRIEFHAQISSVYEELKNEKWSWGGCYLKHRQPCVILFELRSNRRPKYSQKILEKWKEMDNDLSRVSMKFRCQINFVDEEIKKEMSVGWRVFQMPSTPVLYSAPNWRPRCS